jgi:hypothetical protein
MPEKAEGGTFAADLNNLHAHAVYDVKLYPSRVI